MGLGVEGLGRGPRIRGVRAGRLVSGLGLRVLGLRWVRSFS